MKLIINVEGGDVLRRRLAALGDVARGHIIAQAAEAGARVCEAEAKIKAPVDLGTLRNSIKVERGKISATAADMHVGPTVHYGPYLEFGTGIYAEGGDGRQSPWVYWSDRLQRFVRTVGHPAQPYLRPALKEGRQRIVAAINATVRRLLDHARRR